MKISDWHSAILPVAVETFLFIFSREGSGIDSTCTFSALFWYHPLAVGLLRGGVAFALDMLLVGSVAAGVAAGAGWRMFPSWLSKDLRVDVVANNGIFCAGVRFLG